MSPDLALTDIIVNYYWKRVVMDYEGVDANSFTVNLKRKKFPWVLVLCAGFFFAVIVPVIIIQGQPEPVPETSLAIDLEEPAAPEVVVEEPLAEPVPEPVPVVEPAPIIESEPFVEPTPIEEPAPIAEQVAEPAPVVDTRPAPVLPYKNCDDVRSQNRAPLLAGEPGYSYDLDGDKDGTACES